MNKYTTIYFGWSVYQPNKHKLQNLRLRFNVQWNEKKLKENVPYSEIINIYKLFKSENRVVNDDNLKERKGATGLWKNDVSALKIAAFDSVDERESPPVLLIYNGEENEFYNVLIKMCADIGCEIGVLIEDETGIQVIFKKQHTIEEIYRLKDLEKSKSALKEEFDARIKELKRMNCELSDEFIASWKRLIDTYGYYDIRNLLNETSSKQENEGAT